MGRAIPLDNDRRPRWTHRQLGVACEFGHCLAVSRAGWRVCGNGTILRQRTSRARVVARSLIFRERQDSEYVTDVRVGISVASSTSVVEI